MRYSIRKGYLWGTTSALIGTLAFWGATPGKSQSSLETAPAVACDSNTETSTASLTVASETAASVATEAVESSVAHSEVATTPVTSLTKQHNSSVVRRKGV